MLIKPSEISPNLHFKKENSEQGRYRLFTPVKYYDLDKKHGTLKPRQDSKGSYSVSCFDLDPTVLKGGL